MKRHFKFLALTAVALSGLSLVACSNKANQASDDNDPAVHLHYSAAASLQKSLTKAYANFEKTHPKIKIDFDFSGSGAVREKVEAGAPIDAVFLASKADTEKLTSSKKATEAQAVLGNSLVMIANKNSDIEEADSITDTLKTAQKIAIGEPATVPAGKYAEESLDKLGLLSSLKSKFVQASDVTQVLSYVAAGNADVGFVYKTDAMNNKNVKILATVPENLHEKISYYTATVTTTKYNSQVKVFNDYLSSPKAQKIFASYGFSKK
ncbi:molybdate ABC transporter substrate-binding protein [Lactococcus termiticola]|uniref:Putative molybdate ABC transporter molybdate-binding protein n=1 Tax=Lactococcus termiticola TaxID=2169526 RepID=A0A2R5HJG0_9LACT|nr:molybdate ABC transporter substrate-binding protein [Lactococcus termiticola]GBG96718.1 putative molybdate ABC transporter molybdate-binding protein [Lactococcus termiticola]